MLLLNYIAFKFFTLFTLITAKINIDEGSNVLAENSKAGSMQRLPRNDLYFLIDKYLYNNDAKVKVQLYYESLCPSCIAFDKTQFSPTIEKLNKYLDIHTYPYGNARTIERDGHIDFKCQHGPAECYGNKLHACAIDYLQNITKAVIFNACMMEFTGDRGSNDRAADRCASAMYLDSKPIKACAKGKRGTDLLKYYGDESIKANFSFVPYILINGKLNSGDNFMKDICAEFSVPPPPCSELI